MPGRSSSIRSLVREEVARGRMVIPGQHGPLGQGASSRSASALPPGPKSTPISASRPFRATRQCEMEKLIVAVRYGADTVMDLSTGEEIDAVRSRIIEAATVPVGTVPIYQVAQQLDDIVDMRPQRLSGRGRAAGPAGRRLHDRSTPALLREHLPLTERRLTGIVSRGGSLVAKWMLAHTARESVLHPLRRTVRHHAPVRRDLEPGRRVAARLDRRRQRRGPVRRAESDGRTWAAGAAARSAR